jgi:hypothetical protein
MKTSYIFLAFIGILMYNAFLAQKDKKMLEAYDKICAEQVSNPNCIYAK